MESPEIRIARELAEMAQFPEMNPCPVIRMDPSGTVLLANSAAHAFFGEGALLGTLWFAVCPGMTNTAWEHIVAGDRVAMEHEAVNNGVIMKFTHVKSPDGKFFFAFGADITESRRAQLQLAEQARELGELARFPEMNPGPVLRLDVDANVLMANAAARTVFGESVVGKCWRDICPGIDTVMWQTILDASNVVEREARIGDRDFVFHHRRDIAGRLIFVYGADVTMQKRVERALRQADKMATLGTLAAGVAHELNNPAAATRRAAEQLRDAFARLEQAHLQLDAAFHVDGAADLLQSFDQRAREFSVHTIELDPLARADRETEIEDWLDEHDVDDPTQLAPALVGMGLDAAALNALDTTLPPDAQRAIITWAAAAFPVYALLNEIHQGSARISEIVGALKNYSYLGQAPVQSINLHDGLDNTLVILRNKLKAGVNVKREYGDDVPPIDAFGSELNQVWTNILDNAIDAMNGKGEITIRTRRDGAWAVIEIEDNGPGIPAAIQSRIFDPFFTTKAPGKGTGLGLSTSYGIITEKHHGIITVESRPGRTCFTVRLPITAAVSAPNAQS